MKLPQLRALTETQRNVYFYAPTEEHVLVQGAPGTGKTLIAALRAKELATKHMPTTLAMFNRVLMRYTENLRADVEGSLSVRTMNQWFSWWWEDAMLPPYDSCRKIRIAVPYEEKKKIKTLGAHWEAQEWAPWKRNRGCWVVDGNSWAAKRDAFSCWPLWPEVPRLQGDSLSIDWDSAFNHILDHAKLIKDSSLDLGVLLLDEGQDFPITTYKILHFLAALGDSRRPKVKRPLRCFVLADENQQLTDRNSTIDQIIQTLKIKQDCRFVLEDNFRNSKEIAQLAGAFYSDVGVKPILPKRSHLKPVLSTRAGLCEAVSIIST